MKSNDGYSRYVNIIFLFLIAAWFILSVIFTLYNAVKSVSEIKQWYPLSDSQRRYKIFGNLYSFLIFLDSKTQKNSKILVYSKDVRTYYLGIYYTYPRTIYVVDNKKIFYKSLSSHKFDYIAVYGNLVLPDKYTLVGSKPFGKIYVIK